MLIPSKHEKLSNNILVIGSIIIGFVKENPLNIEEAFQRITKDSLISVEQFYNTLTFLWLSNIIEITDYKIKLCS